ncbi:MAG: hypothetical protein H5U40_19460, partial [Polyangiaceae bacterium]|nr:hypothetical protein [Polyangiaceae bacterium]
LRALRIVRPRVAHETLEDLHLAIEERPSTLLGRPDACLGGEIDLKAGGRRLIGRSLLGPRHSPKL